MPHEYNNNMSNSSGYATLSSYNQGCNGGNTLAPVPSSTPSMSVQIIPQFSAPGYDFLSHNNAPSAGNGYFTVTGAYPSAANNGGCTSFVARLCD